MVVVVVIAVEGVETPGEAEETETKLEVKHLQEHQAHPTLPSILISLLENGQGVTCTDDMDEEHTSALNQQPARGRTSSQPSQNENPTSLAAQIQLYFTILYITRQRHQKYTLFVTMKLMSRELVHFKLSSVNKELNIKVELNQSLCVVLLWLDSFTQVI